MLRADAASGPLVARRDELARVEAALARLGPGSPVVVAVTGEPGIGKTRLLAELAVRAKQGGRLVLTGRAAEVERETPFGVVVEAIDDHLAAVGPRRFGSMDDEVRIPLATVFPSVPRVASATEIERHRLHRAVRLLLETLARPHGLVLVLDDLHWADEASVELLGSLLRRPPRAPVLLALGYRSRQASAQLSAAVAAAPAGLVKRIVLGPLAAKEADELLPDGLSRWRRRMLYRNSGGNPFYLQALAQAGEQAYQPLESHSQAPCDPLPRWVRTALLREFAPLSATGWFVAQAAAVAGDPFEPELAAAAAERGEAETITGIDELIGADLVRPGSSPRSFRYRHPLVRAVAYETAGAGWRLAAHARVAQTLAARNASAAVRAPHVERAAVVADDAAIAVLVEAARTTVARAPSSAAQWLQAALRLLTGQNESHRAELLAELAEALMLAGRVRGSRNALHEVLQLLPTEASERRATAVVRCAVAEGALGRHAEARALVRAELAALPNPDAPDGVGLALALATSGLPEGDRGWGEEALAAARRHPHRWPEAVALAVIARTSCTVGDTERAAVCAREAGLLVDALPDGELSRDLRALAWLGRSELYLERYDDALRHLRRGLSIARQRDQLHVVPDLLTALASLHRRLGDLGEAASCAKEAVEAAYLMDSKALRRAPLTFQAHLAVLADDLELALHAADKAVRAGGPVLDRTDSLARAALALARHANGGSGGWVEEVVEAWGGLDLTVWDGPERSEAYELLVRAALEHGDRGAAYEWAQRAEAAADTLRLQVPTGFALLARAQILADRDAPEAAERALAAAACFDQVGNRLEAGRAHLLAGRALAAAGHHSQALDELGRAKTLFGACGARTLFEQVVREQRRPDRCGSPLGDGLAALTPREREVAELVAEGHTNAQIARKLTISNKTVETHLSRAFAKLHVPSRAALASAVAVTRSRRSA